MNKEIRMITLNRIKRCKLRIFAAEDEDWVNWKIVRANERAIEHYMKDYSKEQQRELNELIRWENDNCVLNLEKYGWKVIREENKK